MFKYLKNLKLRQGILTVEYGLILSFVITIGYFFLPGNGLEEKVDGVINVVLGRVSSDTGNYGPSGLGNVPEPPAQEENKNPMANSVVIEALKEAFRSDHCTNHDILNNIITVQIQNGKIQIQTNGSDKMQSVEKYFNHGNGSQTIMNIINGMDGGDTVKDGIYNVEIN